VFFLFLFLNSPAFKRGSQPLTINKAWWACLIAVDFSFLTCFPFLWQDVYNFMLDSGMDPVALDIPLGSSLMNSLQAMKYSTSHRAQDSQPDSNPIDGIMNGVIKQKLKIIPKNFTSVSAHRIASKSVSCQCCDAAIPNVYRWGQQSDSVYHALVNDFMKPRIDEVI